MMSEIKLFEKKGREREACHPCVAHQQLLPASGNAPEHMTRAPAKYCVACQAQMVVHERLFPNYQR